MIDNHNNTHLILGGARSGKSNYAEQLAKESNNEVIYIATAKVLDNEIALRVKRHKQDRPDNWITVEEPLKLADSLIKWSSPERTILVDCLTMWLMNLLLESNSSHLAIEQKDLLKCINKLEGQVILVSNEVGMGIIPMGELTRQYVDEAGRLHQELAKKANRVTLMVAGLPHTLKKPQNPSN